MTPQEATELLENQIGDFAVELCNSDPEICSCIAETNASFWGHDDSEILEIEQKSENEFTFRLWLQVSGEQIEDKPWCGNKITMTVEGTLPADGTIEDYKLSEVKCNF